MFVMDVVGGSRAGNNTERRIREIPKRGRLVNCSKFMVRFKGFFVVGRALLQGQMLEVNDGSLD